MLSSAAGNVDGQSGNAPREDDGPDLCREADQADHQIGVVEVVSLLRGGDYLILVYVGSEQHGLSPHTHDSA